MLTIACVLPQNYKQGTHSLISYVTNLPITKRPLTLEVRLNKTVGIATSHELRLKIYDFYNPGEESVVKKN